jgi:hypothetical protein
VRSGPYRRQKPPDDDDIILIYERPPAGTQITAPEPGEIVTITWRASLIVAPGEAPIRLRVERVQMAEPWVAWLHGIQLDDDGQDVGPRTVLVTLVGLSTTGE